MANDIVEYLVNCQESFAELPLNEVDGLVLAAASYFNFEEGALARKQPSERVPLPLALCGIPRNRLHSALWLKSWEGDKFLAALLQSPRFMELEVAYYTNELSTHFEKQFSAISFFMPDGAVYVAFRGTDQSLVGWKEDFNINFMEQVPSQVRARMYLEDIAALGPARLFVGGHSKGGNLAEYAVLTCVESAFDQVECVFNYDGPGFAFAPSERMDQPAYCNKLRKYVPESCVVGLLLETRESYTIVDARGLLLVQHAPTRWVVKDGRFVEKEALSDDAALVGDTLKDWAATYTPEQIELLVNTMFGVIEATNADSIEQIATSKTASMAAIIEAARQLPEDKRRVVFAMLADIAPIFGSKASSRLREALEAMRSSLPLLGANRSGKDSDPD